MYGLLKTVSFREKEENKQMSRIDGILEEGDSFRANERIDVTVRVF